MPTIKTKKEMNLVGLIEWAWKNTKAVENKIFESDNIGCYGHYSKIYFSNDGHGFYTDGVTDKDIFTVEIEEPITEDTQIYNLRHLTVYGFSGIAHTRSIKEVKDNKSVAFYIMNDDLTMTLIWTKEKGLV